MAMLGNVAHGVHAHDASVDPADGPRSHQEEAAGGDIARFGLAYRAGQPAAGEQHLFGKTLAGLGIEVLFQRRHVAAYWTIGKRLAAAFVDEQQFVAVDVGYEYRY